MSGALDALARSLVVGIAGHEPTAAEKRWIDHWRPAGVILFAHNCSSPAAWARLIAGLRGVLPPGGEICADHEGGAVSFLQAVAGRPPAARTLGELDDTDLTLRVHRETAERLRALGLDRVLAPCCDVLRAASNPVIGARSFGTDPGLVGRHAAAAMKGLAAGGLKGCAKHWPGHGSTRTDTHETAADLAAAAGVLTEDRRPFQAALEAGADALMVGHLPLAPGRPPLTLDADALAGVRSDLGPGILLYSDDVSMGALRAPLLSRGVVAPDGRPAGMADPADLSAEWLLTVRAAGCDRLLLRGIPWRALPVDPCPAGPVSAGEPFAPTGLDLLRTGPSSMLYKEARRRAALRVALRHGDAGLLWYDATGGDRLGEAAALLPAVRTWWPDVALVEAARAAEAAGASETGAQESTGSNDRILVTAHRPLAGSQMRQLRALAATEGVALVAGHPSLAGEVGGMLGSGWRVDALFDCAEPDLSALEPHAATKSSRPFDSP